MVSQEQFDKFVRDYNEDYILLLTRASRREYSCLVSSFLVLKDLYNVIQVTYDCGNYKYEVMPYPFSFRGNDVMLKQFGFSETEVKNIYDFFDFVKRTQGIEFEECMDSGKSIVCPPRGTYGSTQDRRVD